GDLAQGGVRLLRRRRVDARADAPLLRRAAQRGRLHLRLRRLAALADELIDSRHQFSVILLERVGTSLDTNKAGGATTHANPGLDGSEARRPSSNSALRANFDLASVRPRRYMWASRGRVPDLPANVRRALPGLRAASPRGVRHNRLRAQVRALRRPREGAGGAGHPAHSRSRTPGSARHPRAPDGDRHRGVRPRAAGARRRSRPARRRDRRRRLPGRPAEQAPAPDDGRCRSGCVATDAARPRVVGRAQRRHGSTEAEARGEAARTPQGPRAASSPDGRRPQRTGARRGLAAARLARAPCGLAALDSVALDLVALAGNLDVRADALELGAADGSTPLARPEGAQAGAEAQADAEVADADDHDHDAEPD